MATTAIWDVKDNLKRVLDYTSNPNKTEVSENNYQYNGLKQAISYARDDLIMRSCDAPIVNKKNRFYEER